MGLADESVVGVDGLSDHGRGDVSILSRFWIHGRGAARLLGRCLVGDIVRPRFVGQVGDETMMMSVEATVEDVHGA